MVLWFLVIQSNSMRPTYNGFLINCKNTLLQAKIKNTQEHMVTQPGITVDPEKKYNP